MNHSDSYGHFYNPSTDEHISDSHPSTPVLSIKNPCSSPIDWSDTEESYLDKSYSSESSEFEVFKHKPFVTDLEHRPFHNRIERIISLVLVVILVSTLAVVDYHSEFKIQKFVTENFLTN